MHVENPLLNTVFSFCTISFQCKYNIITNSKQIIIKPYPDKYKNNSVLMQKKFPHKICNPNFKTEIPKQLKFPGHSKIWNKV